MTSVVNGVLCSWCGGPVTKDHARAEIYCERCGLVNYDSLHRTGWPRIFWNPISFAGERRP